jgi:hypothetical protein
MKRYVQSHKSLCISIILFCIAIIPRIFLLHLIPIGIEDDNINFILNAKAVFLTGHDLSGTWNPLSLTTLPGEQPQSEIIYLLLAPLIGLFPLSLFFANLPYVLASSLFAVLLYHLTKTLLDEKIAIAAGLLVAINPWSIFFARSAFESPIALLFFTTAWYLLIVLKGYNKLWSLLFLFFGFYTYMTSKLLSRSLPVISPDIVVWIVSERPYSQDETVGTLYSVLNERGVSCVCVSGIVDEASPSFLLEQGRFHQEIRFFRDHADGMDFINSRLVGDAVLLIVKANTKIRSLYKAVNFQVSCERDIVYFSENVISDRKKYSWPTIFYLFKREILGLDHFLAKETLLDVSKEQVCSLEPCAVLVKGAVFSRHTFHLNEESSFLSVWFHLISIDFLKVENPRFSRKKVFMLMPNFFSNIYMSDPLELRRRFLSKGILLHFWGIPHKRWPERKITWYFFKIFSGNPQYCLLVYSFSLKTLILWKDILSTKIQVLERMLRSRP